MRFPPEHKAVYKAAAKAAGLSLCDYVALVMAERHELQVPEYVVRAQRAHEVKSTQEDALPISA